MPGSSGAALRTCRAGGLGLRARLYWADGPTAAPALGDRAQDVEQRLEAAVLRPLRQVDGWDGQVGHDGDDPEFLYAFVTSRYGSSPIERPSAAFGTPPPPGKPIRPNNHGTVRSCGARSERAQRLFRTA